jgi:hypothetical protein
LITLSIRVSRPNIGSVAVNGCIAGILGAIGTDAFISIAHQMSPIKLWQFIASSAFGSVAYSSPSYAIAGVVMHLIIALVWAYLYYIVWSRVNSLHNWVLGGLVWGIVVDVVMDGLMAFRGVLEPQTPNAVIFGLITNCVFYGLPMAWYWSRSARAVAR